MTPELEKKVKRAIRLLQRIPQDQTFFDSYEDFKLAKGIDGLFEDIDCKKFIEDYFRVELD